MRLRLALAVTLLASAAEAQFTVARQGCPSAAAPPAACSTALGVHGRCYSDTNTTPSKPYICNGSAWVLVDATNADTATALAADPADCSSPNFARGINASGTAQCAQPSDVTGNSATATALASNPSDCSSSQFATAIAASGNLTCAQPAAADLSNGVNGAGAVVLASGNAGTATALAADPVDCTLPNVALGINAAGTAQCSQPSNVTGNAATATALAADPAGCTNNFTTDISASGVSSCSTLGTGVFSFLGTPTSANLATAVTNETGSGVLMFGTSPTITTGFDLNSTGTTFTESSSGHAAIEGIVIGLASDKLSFFSATTSAELAGVLSDETGSGGGFVRATSPTIATPSLTGATITAAAAMNSDLKLSFGTAADTTVASIGWNTTQTPDAPFLYTGSLSNVWNVAESADSGFDFRAGPGGTSPNTDPNLCMRSHNQTTTEWGCIRHDGTDMIFQTGNFAGHFRFSNGGTNSGIIMESGQLLDLVGASLRIQSGGNFLFDRTLTAGGTTGAQTINKMAGSVNIAAGASTLVVTNSLASATSLVWVTALTNDTTCALKDVERASGSFTIRTTANCTAETAFGFLLSN